MVGFCDAACIRTAGEWFFANITDMFGITLNAVQCKAPWQHHQRHLITNTRKGSHWLEKTTSSFRYTQTSLHFLTTSAALRWAIARSRLGCWDGPILFVLIPIGIMNLQLVRLTQCLAGWHFHLSKNDSSLAHYYATRWVVLWRTTTKKPGTQTAQFGGETLGQRWSATICLTWQLGECLTNVPPSRLICDGRAACKTTLAEKCVHMAPLTTCRDTLLTLPRHAHH